MTRTQACVCLYRPPHLAHGLELLLLGGGAGQPSATLPEKSCWAFVATDTDLPEFFGCVYTFQASIEGFLIVTGFRRCAAAGALSEEAAGSTLNEVLDPCYQVRPQHMCRLRSAAEAAAGFRAVLGWGKLWQSGVHR